MAPENKRNKRTKQAGEQMLSSTADAAKRVEASFIESVTNRDLGLSDFDMANMSIGEFLSSSVVDAAPVVRDVKGLVKAGMGLRGMNLARQTAAFLKGIGTDSLDEETYHKYARRLQEEPYLRDELRRALTFLDRQDDERKSEALGKCFLCLVLREITLAQFCELKEFIGRLFPDDDKLLMQVRGGADSVNEESLYRFDRLSGIGGVSVEGNTWGMASGKAMPAVEVTPLGRRYCEIVERGDVRFAMDLRDAATGNAAKEGWQSDGR